MAKWEEYWEVKMELIGSFHIPNMTDPLPAKITLLGGKDAACIMIGQEGEMQEESNVMKPWERDVGKFTHFKLFY